MTLVSICSTMTLRALTSRRMPQLLHLAVVKPSPRSGLEMMGYPHAGQVEAIIPTLIGMGLFQEVRERASLGE